MKKIITVLMVLVLASALLTACACEHEWTDADCKNPKTCSLCGETEGAPLGHSWLTATCTAPKTCEVCGETQGDVLAHTWTDADCANPKTCSSCGLTEGEALGHSWLAATCTVPETCSLCGETGGAPLGHSWLAATCTAPKTCEVCGDTQGEALAHDWTDADCVSPKTCSSCGLTEGEALGHVFTGDMDCKNPPVCSVCGVPSSEPRDHEWLDATTEKPKTCSLCGKTEGKPIKVDSRFTTAKCQDIFGTWTGTATMSTEDMGIEGVNMDVTYTITMVFRGDGTVQETIVLDRDSYVAAMTEWTVDYIYSMFASEGMSKKEADDALKAVYGMGVREYVEAGFAELSEEDLTSDFERVYYVEDGQLYTAESWDDEFTPSRITLKGNSLTVEDELKTIVFTRVK